MIVVIAIIATLVVVSYNGIQVRATKTAMAADLNSAHKLVENHRATNATVPTAMSEVNNGKGFTPSNQNDVQYSGGMTPGAWYCITINHDDLYMKYDSATDSTSDGYCDGHGPVPPAQVAFASGMNTYSTANTTYPITPGVALQSGDVIVSFHSEHYIVGSAYLEVNGASQAAALTKSLGTGSNVFRVTIVTNVTPSTTLAFRTDGSSVAMGYYILRGLRNPTTYAYQEVGWTGSSVPGGTVVTVPSQSLRSGQVAIMGANSTLTYITFPYNPTPTIADWTIDHSGSGMIQLAHVIGTADIPSVSAGIQTSGSNFLGGIILIFGS